MSATSQISVVLPALPRYQSDPGMASGKKPINESPISRTQR